MVFRLSVLSRKTFICPPMKIASTPKYNQNIRSIAIVRLPYVKVFATYESTYQLKSFDISIHQMAANIAPANCCLSFIFRDGRTTYITRNTRNIAANINALFILRINVVTFMAAGNFLFIIFTTCSPKTEINEVAIIASIITIV